MTHVTRADQLVLGNFYTHNAHGSEILVLVGGFFPDLPGSSSDSLYNTFSDNSKTIFIGIGAFSTLDEYPICMQLYSPLTEGEAFLREGLDLDSPIFCTRSACRRELTQTNLCFHHQNGNFYCVSCMRKINDGTDLPVCRPIAEIAQKICKKRNIQPGNPVKWGTFSEWAKIWQEL